MSDTNQQIQIFTSDDGQVQLEIKLQQETLWLPQSHISELFATSTDNVSLHLKNIYSEHELEEPATTEDFSVVRREGQREVKRTLKHYNLDAIISVGYRVNSARATQLCIPTLPRGNAYLSSRFNPRFPRRSMGTSGVAGLFSFPRSRVGMHTDYE